jgi:hypothetical protein
MRTSDSITAIAPALVKAQAACESVTKDKVGKIETKSGAKYEYNYADFASVVEHIKPALRDNGLAMIQWGERHDDGITVVTRVQHESGEWQETDTFIPLAIASAQALGSALTYGKRYGAQAFMLLPSADDDGNEATLHPAAGNGSKSIDGPPRKMRPAEFQQHCTAMAACTKKEPLQKAYTAAVLAARGIGDEDAVAAFQRKKDEIKAMIASAEALELGSQP